MHYLHRLGDLKIKVTSMVTFQFTNQMVLFDINWHGKNKKARKHWVLRAFGFGWIPKSRDDKIRTCDPFVPNEVRYRAALHPELNSAYDSNWSYVLFTGYNMLPPGNFCPTITPGNSPFNLVIKIKNQGLSGKKIRHDSKNQKYPNTKKHAKTYCTEFDGLCGFTIKFIHQGH